MTGKTFFSPEELIFFCKSVEFFLGRRQKEQWTERKIDIDILLFNSRTINEKKLIIPHNYMCNRRFVLEPASEIAPDILHPVAKKSILELLLACDDTSKVEKVY